MRNKIANLFSKVTGLALFAVSGILTAQPSAENTLDRIRHEAATNSHAMSYLETLSDRFGPRVSSTPNYLQAAQWAVETLKSEGIEQARLERYEVEVPGWELQEFSFDLIEPRYSKMTAFPAMWSKNLDTPTLAGFVVVQSLDLESLSTVREQVSNKIVIVADTVPIPDVGPMEYDSATLRKASYRNNHFVADGLGGSSEELSIEILESKEGSTDDELLEVVQSLEQWGAVAIVVASSLDYGLLEVTDVDFYPVARSDVRPIPLIFLSREHHSRIIRLVNSGHEPTARLTIKAQFYENPDYAVNIIAEIPGTDRSLSQEVVLLGAHFDTWHGSPGVADNGAGVAVMMEALRILSATGVSPRRTIRIGLWGSEEQGLFSGSWGYAKKVFGPLEDPKSRQESDSHVLYLNQDTGTGKIRGIFLHGNELARRFFNEAFGTLQHLPVETVTTEDSSGSDQVVFDAYNVPAFEFLQNPELYGTHQHHTNMDVIDFVYEENLRHNATVIATLAYLASMREEAIPRKSVDVN